jgi:hypothetical protein
LNESKKKTHDYKFTKDQVGDVNEILKDMKGDLTEEEAHEVFFC